MSILTEEMRRVVQEHRRAFVATVCPDGTPHLSPKGPLTAWDDEHLAFANITSPRTVENLRHNPASAINVVDALVRKGYRFKGTASVLTEGAIFEEIVAIYRRRRSIRTIRQIVLVRVERSVAVVSPVYATGATDAEVRQRWASDDRSLDTAPHDVDQPQDV